MTRATGAIWRPADIDAHFAPARSVLTVERVIDDDLLLLDPDSGSTHVLNATGRVLWSGLDGQTSLRELTEDLADAIGAPVDDLIAPVLSWARTLGMNGLLDGVVPSEGDLLGAGVAATGAVLPAIVGQCLDGGDTVRLPVDGGRRAVLVNWSFGCGYCLAMVDVLQEARPLLDAQRCDVVLLVAGDRHEVEAAARPLGLADVVVLVEAIEGAPGDDDPFRDLGTPVAYVVDGDGVVSEPIAFGGGEVSAALRRLAGLAPVPVDQPSPGAAEPDEDDGGPRYLALAPSAGVCAPSRSRRARTWDRVDTFTIGDLVVGVRAASASAGQLVGRLLATSACEAEHRQPNYSVVLPTLDDASSHELNLLLQGDTVVVRSRSVRRVIDALLAYLASHTAPDVPDRWRIAAFPVTKDGRAVLLPDDLRSNLARIQPQLTRAGLSMVDLPTAIVDLSTAELVVPPARVSHDSDVVAGLGSVHARGTELPPAAPGRYPLAAWLFPDPGPGAGVAATSLALAVAAIARPRDAVLLTDVAALLQRVPVAVVSDLRTIATKASDLLA
ncbi:MAG: PqqD family peptide modification chaperone [Actinomycetota bacterium]|nr:PqqD family peptide modification chaperone [Actinomycetota bacterium]